MGVEAGRMPVGKVWVPAFVIYNGGSIHDFVHLHFRDGSILAVIGSDVKSWDIPWNWFAINLEKP